MAVKVRIEEIKIIIVLIVFFKVPKLFGVEDNTSVQEVGTVLMQNWQL